MKKQTKTLTAMAVTLALTTAAVTGCAGNKESETVQETSAAESTTSKEAAAPKTETGGEYYLADATAQEVIADAASKGKIGNWGLGNEYEVQALLTKYGQDTSFLSQAFDMDGFDDDSILLASAMTFNELGLVKNTYKGGYAYGDSVKTIDMNDEGLSLIHI